MSLRRLPPLLPALALVAALLLALLPSVGRLYQAAQSAPPDTIALCTVEGFKQAAAPLWALADAAAHHRNPGGEPSAHDCDYCPLLSGLVVLAFIALAFWPLATFSPRRIEAASPRVGRRHPCGLGSRGPPAGFRSC